MTAIAIGWSDAQTTMTDPRSLVLLVVAIASESIVRFIVDSQREDRSVTLKGFAIRQLPPAK